MTTPLATANPLPNVTSADIDTLARTIYGESRGESIEGQAAVAWVVRNRVEAKRKSWGRTVADVCRWPKQFSCWNDRDPNRERIDWLRIQDPGYLRALWLAAAVLSGDYADPTGGATHYLALKSLPKGPPKWWAKLRVTVKLGNHTFSREA